MAEKNSHRHHPHMHFKDWFILSHKKKSFICKKCGHEIQLNKEKSLLHTLLYFLYFIFSVFLIELFYNTFLKNVEFFIGTFPLSNLSNALICGAIVGILSYISFIIIPNVVIVCFFKFEEADNKDK